MYIYGLEIVNKKTLHFQLNVSESEIQIENFKDAEKINGPKLEV